MAGTSLELALSRFLRAGDLATPIGEEGKRRWLDRAVFDSRFIAEHGQGTQFSKAGIRKLYDHAPLSLAFEHFGESIREYRVITAERNPWQKLVSLFYWDNRMRSEVLKADSMREDFAQFLKSERANTVARASMYSVRGTPIADFIIRYEHLAKDLQECCAHFRLPDPPDIKGIDTKRSARPRDKKQGQAEFLFTAKQNAYVRKIVKRELRYLRYDGPNGDCPAYVAPAARMKLRDELIHGRSWWPW